MSKRPGSLNIGSLMAKKSKLDEKTAANAKSGSGGAGGHGGGQNNPYLSKPVHPEKMIQILLTQFRNSARNYSGNKANGGRPYTSPFCEVEARIGILKVHNRRVTSSGPKQINGAVVKAFDGASPPRGIEPPSMVSGISRSNYVGWTLAGLSEASPISSALGVMSQNNKEIKQNLNEHEYVETVFAGYQGDRRVCFPGYVDVEHPSSVPVPTKSGQMEYKEKLDQRDLIIPAAKYDLRIGLASEKIVDPNVTHIPAGWSLHRVKRRRSYKRKDTNMGWQIDVTEVTSTSKHNPSKKTVVYEIEMELQAGVLLKLINMENPEQIQRETQNLAKQLWWMLSQINPLEETVDVEEYLIDHPNKKAVQLALATCGALKKFMDGRPPYNHGQPVEVGTLPLANPEATPAPSLSNTKFCGCMPVNFSRHNIEDVQRGSKYFLSEKTDGVRHFMIFTGDTVVLVDRAMRGKQPIPLVKSGGGSAPDPMAHVIPLIKPGTVFDGEVVMHRGNGNKHKARPLFIVFDVLTIGPTTAVLHLPFEKRLEYLRNCKFRTPSANRDMFADATISDINVPLPLVRKNFVMRTEIVDLLSHVVEEKGFRSYRRLPVHNHLTDGIIFQPNLPYSCGTDVNLLKWKYLDTVTIDVQILLEGGYRHRGGDDDDDDPLNTGVMGPDNTSVDMSRYVKLPASERFRLEADKMETNARIHIAEVGFDPLSGEWYYLTMRPDKIAPNHISTVLGTLLELSESLTTEELQYRMSIPPGQRDTYRKDLKGMMKQLLSYQKQSINKQQQQNRR
mmetsp:Transcript_26426/g.62063  ORF Transcript_26426/g.62063 Transcript_26426/m.62063 type:complete len:788 (-) Transcript_26426:65-2428(-)|eukprot:CAMPEP_0197188000 /NCGR_PEP_ID=MMETSP1423-20130617/17020_1 /TAXON_ID=476441 /ORGANISM="Pseudo-nitzschia heimii, Strain UNC1101" /LENGTH=787 /DNA_ID=CAMNT_0042639729 /DNA_START=27 /DNA_END=2390 /DNA_ORIENTATION=+